MRLRHDLTRRIHGLAPSLRDARTWRITGEFGWVLAGQAGGVVGSVALMKTLTATLGVEQFGRYALGMTLAVFLNQFLFGPLTLAAVRYYSAYRESGRAHPFMRALARLTRRVTLGVLLATAILVPVVLWRYGLAWAALFGLAGGYGIAQNVFALFNGLDAAARNRARVAMYQALDPALRLVAAALGMWLLARTAWAAMLGVAVAMATIMFSQRSAFRTALTSIASPAADEGVRSSSETDAIVRTLFGYARYFVLTGIFTALQLSSDRWALKLYLDDAAVGMYAAVFQLASFPSVVLAGCLSQFFSPIVFQRAQDGSSLEALTRARHAMLVGTAVLSGLVLASTIGAAAVARPLIVLITSRAYEASAPYLAPLVLGLGLVQIGQMLSLFPLSSNRLNGYLAVKIVYGVIATTANVIGARQFGLAGLCVASVVSGACYVVLVLWNNARIARTIAVPSLVQVPLQPQA